MKYKKSERVQFEDYSSISEFINDVIETVLDDDNFEGSANIISNRQVTEDLLEYIMNSDFEFKFDVQLIDFRDDIDEYIITILDIGEVYVEPAINSNDKYYDLDGFIFVHKDICSIVYNENNRKCDTLVFQILE